ncbi:unnamed protein product [Phytophthora lilii]|uniref:Unnamed protein product n=1 Tax=Phytophthora lilii TaxID=2077276 RepID=A0A9W6U4R1_9STRA|nr:unnamed protein product [Phytophthora lilii]
MVQTDIRLMFPGIPDRLAYIAEYCLASIYHYSYLKQTLAPTHPIYETPFFQDSDLPCQLFRRVKIGDGSSETRIRPTGVPPHVSILCEMKWLKVSLIEALSQLELTRIDTVNDIICKPLCLNDAGVK